MSGGNPANGGSNKGRSVNVPPMNTNTVPSGINPVDPGAYGYPYYGNQMPVPPQGRMPIPPQGQVPAAARQPSRQPSRQMGQPPVSSAGQPAVPMRGQAPGAPRMPGMPTGNLGGPAPRYPQEPMDARRVAQLAEEQHPDLVDLRTRVPSNMPSLAPASATRAARRKKRQGEVDGESGKSSTFVFPGGLSIPGDPNADLSFKELLGQPVSNLAASTIASPRELEDSDGLQFRAVGLAVGPAPEPDVRYPIPYIAREHPSYYTGYEVSLIMESIRDPEHARQVLARIVAIPRWVRWVISLFGGLCGAAVSALNGFLSLLAFGALMAVVLVFTYSFASRIGSGRFYDPTGYKTIWLGAFMPIGLLSAIIVARAVVPQPWLALAALILTTLCGVVWITWIQKFQINRLLSSEIPDAAE